MKRKVQIQRYQSNNTQTFSEIKPKSSRVNDWWNEGSEANTIPHLQSYIEDPNSNNPNFDEYNTEQSTNPHMKLVRALEQNDRQQIIKKMQKDKIEQSQAESFKCDQNLNKIHFGVDRNQENMINHRIQYYSRDGQDYRENGAKNFMVTQLSKREQKDLEKRQLSQQIGSVKLNDDILQAKYENLVQMNLSKIKTSDFQDYDCQENSLLFKKYQKIGQIHYFLVNPKWRKVKKLTNHKGLIMGEQRSFPFLSNFRVLINLILTFVGFILIMVSMYKCNLLKEQGRVDISPQNNRFEVEKNYVKYAHVLIIIFCIFATLVKGGELVEDLFINKFSKGHRSSKITENGTLIEIAGVDVQLLNYVSTWTTDIFDFKPRSMKFDPYLFEELHWDGKIGARQSRLHIPKFNYMRVIASGMSLGFYCFISLTASFNSEIGQLFFYMAMIMVFVEQAIRIFICYRNIKELKGVYTKNLVIRCIANAVMNSQKIFFFGNYTGSLGKNTITWVVSPTVISFMLCCLTTYQFIFCCKGLPRSLKRCFDFQKGEEFNTFGAVLSSYHFIAFFIAMTSVLVEGDSCNTGVGMVILSCFVGCAVTVFLIYVLVKRRHESVNMYDVRVAARIKELYFELMNIDAKLYQENIMKRYDRL